MVLMDPEVDTVALATSTAALRFGHLATRAHLVDDRRSELRRAPMRHDLPPPGSSRQCHKAAPTRGERSSGPISARGVTGANDSVCARTARHSRPTASRHARRWRVVTGQLHGVRGPTVEGALATDQPFVERRQMLEQLRFEVSAWCTAHQWLRPAAADQVVQPTWDYHTPPPYPPRGSGPVIAPTGPPPPPRSDARRAIDRS